MNGQKNKVQDAPAVASEDIELESAVRELSCKTARGP